MDKVRRNYDFIQVIAVLTFWIAFVLSIYLSIYLDQIVLKYPNTVNISIVLPWVLLFSFTFGSYTDCFDFGGKRFFDQLLSVYITIFLTAAFTMILPYFGVEYKVSKKILLVAFIIMIILLSIWLLYMRKLYYKLTAIRKVLLISNKKDITLESKINHYSKRYRIAELIHPQSEKLNEIIKKYDVIFIDHTTEIERTEIMSYCVKKKKSVLVNPTINDIEIYCTRIEQIGDSMILSSLPLEMSLVDRFFKRFLDVFVSGIGLVVLLPLFFIIVCLVFLEDFHSPIYKQERLTRNCKVFTVFKFRSMIVNAEDEAPLMAEVDDARITKIGKILRKYRLDELPQLLNVLMGQMSLVGPRPEREYYYNLFSELLPEFNNRLAVKAGITGYSQVWGNYTTGPKEKLLMDMMYIRSYSFGLDIKILLETVRVLFTKESSLGFSDTSKLNDSHNVDRNEKMNS